MVNGDWRSRKRDYGSVEPVLTPRHNDLNAGTGTMTLSSRMANVGPIPG